MFSPVAGQSVWETLTASVLTLPARRLGWALVGQGVSDLRGYKVSRTMYPMTTPNPSVLISVFENVTNYITKALSMDVEIFLNSQLSKRTTKTQHPITTKIIWYLLDYWMIPLNDCCPVVVRFSFINHSKSELLHSVWIRSGYKPRPRSLCNRWGCLILRTKVNTKRSSSISRFAHRLDGHLEMFHTSAVEQESSEANKVPVERPLT